MIIATAALLWLIFMAVHELGHVLAALATGGSVQGIELRPWRLSRTELATNPSPLLVVWAGPILGTAFPLAALGIAHLAAPISLRRWTRALAAFCCLVNGIYIASGTIAPAGDTADLLRLGSPPWTLALFGIPTAIAGLWLLHTLGPWLGTRSLSSRAITKYLAWTIATTIVLGTAMTTLSLLFPA